MFYHFKLFPKINFIGYNNSIRDDCNIGLSITNYHENKYLYMITINPTAQPWPILPKQESGKINLSESL